MFKRNTGKNDLRKVPSRKIKKALNSKIPSRLILPDKLFPEKKRNIVKPIVSLFRPKSKTWPKCIPQIQIFI